jgi:hypothetical protein
MQLAVVANTSWRPARTDTATETDRQARRIDDRETSDRRASIQDEQVERRSEHA